MVKDRNLEFGTYIEHNMSKTYEDMWWTELVKQYRALHAWQITTKVCVIRVTGPNFKLWDPSTTSEAIKIHALNFVYKYIVSQKGGHFQFYNNFGKSRPNFIFFTVKFRQDLREKLEFKLSPSLKSVAALPCEKPVVNYTALQHS